MFLSLQLLKLGEINGVKMLAWKSNRVKFWSNLMSVFYIYLPTTLLSQDRKLTHDRRLQLGFTKKMGQLDILPSRYMVFCWHFTCFFVSNSILSICFTGVGANLLNGNSGSNEKVKSRLLSENVLGSCVSEGVKAIRRASLMVQVFFLTGPP